MNSKKPIVDAMDIIKSLPKPLWESSPPPSRPVSPALQAKKGPLIVENAQEAINALRLAAATPVSPPKKNKTPKTAQAKRKLNFDKKSYHPYKKD